MRLLLIGLAAGFFSALFGVGGGIVIVPLLLLAGRWEIRSATGTSLAAIGITATAGVVVYVIHGEVEPVYAALVGVPAAFGALGGTALATAAAGAHALVPVRRAARRHRDPDAPAMTYVLAVLLGVLAGILSGLFGVGGGILFVPTLTALGLTQLHAEASSLLAIIPTVIVGVWRQKQYGNVRWRPAAIIGVASIGAAVGGAKVAESLNEATLRKLFAVLLLLVAAQITWRARKGS